MQVESFYEIGDTVFLIKETKVGQDIYYKAEKDLITGIFIQKDKTAQYELRNNNREFYTKEQLYEDATKCIDQIIELITPTINT